MAETVFDRVAALLSQNLDISPDKIRPEADLRHDLGLDSFAAVELGYAVEEEFSIKVTDQELSSVKTISDLVESIGKKVGGESPAPQASPSVTAP
jgi:acyl carrier protein